MNDLIFKEINGITYPIVLEESENISNVEQEVITDTRTYEQKVVDFIRKRYTIDQELAIQRQRYTKPEEFVEYDAYCEQCKLLAKGE